MPYSAIGFPGIGIPSGIAAVSLKDETDDYTLLDDDLLGSVYVRMNKASIVYVTVPSGLINLQPVNLIQAGLGTMEVVADVGVTIHSTDGWTKARTRYSSLTLVPLGSDTYDLIGDLAE